VDSTAPPVLECSGLRAERVEEALKLTDLADRRDDRLDAYSVA
jgi:hypothetical protein